MTDEPSPQTKSSSSSKRRLRPLPITIVPGMQVVDMSSQVAATIVGFTEAFCIYKIETTDSLSVASWRDIAVGPVCPAEPSLPADVTENDRRNASAAVLRELLALKQFGLSPTQTALHDELVNYLCS